MGADALVLENLWGYSGEQVQWGEGIFLSAPNGSQEMGLESVGLGVVSLPPVLSLAFFNQGTVTFFLSVPVCFLFLSAFCFCLRPDTKAARSSL